MNTRIIDVITGFDFRGSPVQLVEVELRCNGERRDVILDAERRGGHAEFSAADAATDVAYRYRVYLNGSVTGEQRYESPQLTTDASVLVVDPRVLFRIVPLSAVPVFDPEAYTMAFVDYRLGSLTTTLQVDPGNKDFREVVLAADAPPQLEVRQRHVKRGGEMIEGPWRKSDGTTVAVANPVVGD